MANLIVLHLDKDTGSLVAAPVAGGGGGGGGGGPSQFGLGYFYDQPLLLSTWTINHAVGEDKLLCQIYTTSGELIIPDKLTIVNINTIEIEFGSPFAGRAHVVFFAT